MEIQTSFNRVFCDDGLGTQVFTQILLDLDLFQILDTPDAVARHNAAIRLLIRTGVLSPTRRSQVIENLLTVQTRRAIRRMTEIRVPPTEE